MFYICINGLPEMLAFYPQDGHSPLDLARKKIEEKKDEGLTAEAEPLYKAVALLESSHKVFDVLFNSKDFSRLLKHMIGRLNTYY